MPDQQDPVRLIASASAIAALLANVALSVLTLRDYLTARELALIEPHQVSTAGRELERCRIITPEQLASDHACRRAWAEHRQRFFGLHNDAGKTSTTKVPTPPSLPSEPSPEIKNRAGADLSTDPTPRLDF
jgi:conjugative transfer region protein TrbK